MKHTSQKVVDVVENILKELQEEKKTNIPEVTTTPLLTTQDQANPLLTRQDQAKPIRKKEPALFARTRGTILQTVLINRRIHSPKNLKSKRHLTAGKKENKTVAVTTAGERDIGFQNALTKTFLRRWNKNSKKNSTQKLIRTTKI